MSRKKIIHFRPLHRNEAVQKGFTLFELLISIVIVAIIVSIMFSSLRMGLMVWDKGEKESKLLFRLQIIRKLVKTQVASICTEPIFGSGPLSSYQIFMLKGDETEVEFVSRFSILPGHACRLVYVRYYLSRSEHERNLMLLEKSFCLPSDYEAFTATGPDLQNVSAVVLVKNIEAIKFEYLKQSTTGELQVFTSWDLENEPRKEFPDAMRIHLQVDQMESNINVRLMTQ